MVCDTMIDLLKSKAKVKEIRGMIDFYTENEEVNQLVDKVKSILRVIDDEEEVNNLPLEVVTSIVILAVIGHNAMLIDPEMKLEDAVGKLESAYVSNFSVIKYNIIRNQGTKNDNKSDK